MFSGFHSKEQTLGPSHNLIKGISGLLLFQGKDIGLLIIFMKFEHSLISI